MTTTTPRPVRKAPAPQHRICPLLQELISQRQILLCQAIRILGAADRAEDVLQEAALRCLSRETAAAEIERPAQFARRMVRNLAIDRLRRDRHLITGDLPDLPMTSDNPEASVSGRQTLKSIDTLLQSCPDRDREVFYQHRVMGEAQNRLAERFGLSAARVNAIIGRVHTQLAPLCLEALTG